MMGFYARYEKDDGGEFVLSLSEAVEVLAADGSKVPAYKMEYHEPVADLRLVSHLDGAFRLIRTDRPCAEQVDDECVRDRVWWSVAGSPAWWGVGLPRLVDGGVLTAWQLDAPLNLDIRVERQGSETRYTIPPYDEALEGAAGVLAPGRYTFSRERLVPDRMEGMMRSGRAFADATLVDFQEGDALPSLPALPAPPEVAAPHAVGHFQPMDIAWPWHSHSWSELISHAGQASAAFADAATQGCIVAWIKERQPGGGDPLLPFGERVVASYEVRTLAEEQTTWAIQLRKDRFNGSTSWRVEEQGSMTVQMTCDGLSRQPGPCLDGDALLGHWRDLGFRMALAPEAKHEYTLEPRPYQAHLGNGGNGTLRYRLFMVPEWIDTTEAVYAYEPHMINVHAGRGWLLYADLHSQDMERLTHPLACVSVQ